MSAKRWVITILSFVATIGVSLYIVLTSWPTQKTPAKLPLAGHLLALAAVVLEIVSRGWKIRLSGAALRIPLTFGAAVRTSLGGDFGAAITPGRTGAEPARFLILREGGVNVANTLVLLFVELFLEMLSLAVVAVTLAVVFRGAGSVMTGVVSLITVYALFVLALGVIGLGLARRDLDGGPPPWMARIGIRGRRWEGVRRSLLALRASVTAFRNVRVGVAVAALLASVVHVACRLTVLPILVYTLLGHADWGRLSQLVLWPLALFYGGVVAPVPGGGGFIEIVFKRALGGDIPAPLFSASLIWWRFYTFYLYVILGGVAAGRSVMRAIREGDGDDEAADDDEAAPREPA